MLWLSSGNGGLEGVPPLLRYQAVPTATAPRAISVDGSDKNPTKDSDILSLTRL